MSLLDELKSVVPGYNGVNRYVVEEEIDNIDCVSDEFRTSGRWSEHWTAVFERDGEFVALDYEVPATEMQEGGDFDHEFYVVEPYEVVTTKFRRVN